MTFKPFFTYTIFGQPYHGHMKPEHYDFLSSLPADAVNAAIAEEMAKIREQYNLQSKEDDANGTT